MKLFENGIQITSAMQRCLENDLLDIEEWITQAIKGKSENCWTRFRDHWVPILQDDPNVESMPMNRDAFIAIVLARPDYMNRVERDAEETRLLSGTDYNGGSAVDAVVTELR